MKTDLRAGVRIVLAGTLAMLLAACGSGEPTVNETPTSAAPSTVAPSDDATAAFAAALARSEAASSYSFTGQVRTASTGGTLVVSLAGSVSGADRELTLIAGDARTVVKVVGGVATVDRGDGPQEVALADAPGSPDLSLLGQLSGAEIISSGMVQGTVPASEVVQSQDPDAQGLAVVTVTWDDGGYVTGYVIEALNGDYRAEVAFTDFA